MRVLIVAGSYPPEVCGVGDYMRMLASALASLPTVNVAVLAKSDTPQEPLDDLQVLAIVERWKWSELAKICASARAWSPSVVHIHYPTQGFRGRLPVFLPLMLRCFGFPVVVTLHELPPIGRGRAARYLLPLLGAAGLIYVRPPFLSAFSKVFQGFIKRRPYALIESASAVPVSGLVDDEFSCERERWLDGRGRLLVFFGFVYRNKGLEALIDLAVPGLDRVVIAGKIGDPLYAGELKQAAEAKGIGASVEFTGYLSDEVVADLLAVADAVVLPFVEGGGVWNTSIHGAVSQGTFVVTTGREELGFHSETNTYVALPGDTRAMKTAIERHSGKKISRGDWASSWRRVASTHLDFYERCIADRKR